MSGGFWGWLAGPWGTAALTFTLFTAGLCIGIGWGFSRAREQAYEDGYNDALADERDRATIPIYRLTDVGEATDSRAQAGAATGPQRSTDRSLRVGNPLALAHPLADEWEPVHVAQALAIANEAAITTGEIQAITDDMDVWLAEHVYGVPYSADELYQATEDQ